MLTLKESGPDDWKDSLLEDFLTPLRASHSRNSVKHKSLQRTLSLSGANDDTVVEVKRSTFLFFACAALLLYLPFSHLL